MSDTRFIVTLDGVDPEEYDEDGQEESVTDVRKTELVQEVLPQVVAKVTPPKIKPFSISLRDSDGKDFNFQSIKTHLRHGLCLVSVICSINI